MKEAKLALGDLGCLPIKWKEDMWATSDQWLFAGALVSDLIVLHYVIALIHNLTGYTTHTDSLT